MLYLFFYKSITMKKIFFTILLFASFAFGQTELPSLTLKDLDSQDININSDFSEADKLYVFSFWATWCAPCIRELAAINENYEEWQEEINFEVIAVSIDDSRTKKRVNAMVNGKGWPYKVLLDTNHDLKRALSIINVPYLIVVKNNKIVHIANGYTEGAEEELYQTLKGL